MSRHHPPLPPPPPVDLFASATSFYTSSSRPSTRDGGAIGGSGTGPIGGDHAMASTLPPLTQSLSATSIASNSSNTTTITREHKPSFSRKSASFSAPRRRGSSVTNAGSYNGTNHNSNAVITDAAAPPALPDYALSAAAKVTPLLPPLTIAMPQSSTSGSREREREFDLVRSPTSEDSFGKMLSRTGTTSSMAVIPHMPPPTPVNGGGSGTFWQPGDGSMVHQQITDLANKRISTFDYLRKAHEGGVYWFNAYLFERPDLNRMPSFDPRRLSRRATNYLLLGLSIPVIIDLYSASPLDFLRSLSALLSEFDSFQQLRNESSSSASLARARLPNMFRRPGGKGRRSTSAADTMAKEAAEAMYMASNGGMPDVNGPAGTSTAPSVRNFAASESDLFPGEEYTYLLTPSLPFEPDYFETFATLCDVLIDCYQRFLALIASPKDCNGSVAELFTKADARVRKIIVQGVAKEFEDNSRANIKGEMAGIGRVVLSGLM